MKHSVLKRQCRLMALLLACLISSVVRAQQPPQPCHITITGDFESLCLLPLDKDSVYNEEPETIIACQESTVNYTASTNTGGIPVAQWSWSVVGASSWNDNGNGSITVTWGNGTTGQITVEITTAANFTCSLTQNVKLIEKPDIYVSTVPAYTEMQNGDKIITVCKGETIEFSDLSSTTNSDIVGYSWECDNPTITSSTPNFRLDNILDDCKVTHRVYNNCGCYDEEVYYIKVIEGELLKLSCYGTVCHNAVVTYTAENPPCDQYSWFVEGGTIIGSQNQQTVTVQWDNPQNGYGIIGLDGILCGQDVCPTMLSNKIPIIEDTVTIKGQEVACVDEAVIYSIPLYGSTRYTWDIQPTNGAEIFEVNGANQKGVVFTQPGTYQITVSYECEFLDCGEFTSKPLTVTVKPKLEITGEERICITNNCDLKTDPNVAAIWKVYDIDNGDAVIHTTPNVSNFSFHFPHAGKYRVTAENSNYCRPAVFVITVVAAPPTPTYVDFDPNNPTVACPHSGILLKANPTNPDYTIVWEPSCADADPQTVSGNSVTINYQNTVCDINAYSYDRVLGCLSETPYVHTVSEFQLASHSLPTNITVCPGAELNWNVPYQDGVIYEWQLENGNQHCASIQSGSHFDNSISLLINELVTYPKTFKLTLKREYCSNNVQNHTINITIANNIQSTITINNPSPVCQNTQVQLNGTGCSGNDIEWHIENNVIQGSPINYTFHHAGSIPVTLMCNPYYSCPNSNYYASSTILVNVNPEPPVTNITSTGANVQVDPLLSTTDYDFNWGHTSTNSNIVSAIAGVYDYTCTVTDKVTHCEKTISANVQPCQNTLIVLTDLPYDYCTNEISFYVQNATDNITWNVTGGDYTVESITGIYGEYIIIRMNEAGNFTITARMEGTTCHTGAVSFTIPFVHYFTFEKACSNIIIHNKSHYTNGNKLIEIKYNGTPVTFPASQSTIYIPTTTTLTTYNFVLTGYDGNTINCPLGSVTIQNTSGTPVSIDLSNHTLPLYQTCHNTPIMLTASLPSPHTIVTSDWNFGDFSSSSHSNPIYHTFDESSNDYTVSVTVSDENACTLNDSVSVHSNHNYLKPENILFSNNIQCDGNPRKIYFDLNTPNAIYAWSSGCIPPNTINVEVLHTGDYSVEVSNPFYCKARKMRNVPFMNNPTAIIVTASTIYCEGETIKFYGSPDPDSNSYTFDWKITDNSTGNYVNYPYATISYTPSHAGNYTVDLTITSSNGCSAFTSEIITVNPTPQMPTIFFNGNECLDRGAVELSGTTPTTPASIINWSNGYTGPNANYYTAGEARAWYYDINTGCKSKEAKIHIEPQPDFDALLTGCYKKCRGYFETNPRLPVWGLTSGREDLIWKWLFNTNNIANGTVSHPDYSLSLPLQGFGDYNLHLDYNNGICGTLISPTLTIEPKDTCDCKDLDVSYEYEMRVEDCRIYYEVDVSVCNNSNNTDCLRALEYLFNEEYIRVVYTDFTNTSIAPNDCYTFHLTIEALQFVPSSTISFRLFDECNNCTTNFSINLMPEKFECEVDMQLVSFDINPEWSSNVAAYFDFKFDVSPCQSLIAFWSEPPMVINYWYDGSAIVQGLGMVSYATLTQMIAEGGKVCFYAITCEGDQLCRRMYCIPAEEILHILQEMGIEPRQSSDATSDNDGNGTKQSKSQELGNDTTPQLMPNPTTGEVNVIGTSDEVVEVLVMDMNGRKIATFENTSNFNISTLPSGIYIVRVKTHRDNTDKVTYLKLVKK